MDVTNNKININKEGGKKENQGKIDWTLVPWGALEDVVKVMEYGAAKYTRDNWKKVYPVEYIKAAFRHLIKFQEGERVDHESGLPTLAHAICDLLYAHHNISTTSVTKVDNSKQYYLDFMTDQSTGKGVKC